MCMKVADSNIDRYMKSNLNPASKRKLADSDSELKLF